MAVLSFGRGDDGNRALDAFMTMKAFRDQRAESGLRQAAGEREADSYLRQLEADEALREGMTALPPDAPRAAVQAQLAKALGDVPGSGKTLYDLRAADWTRQDAATTEASKRGWEREKFGYEQTAKEGQAEREHALKLSEIGAQAAATRGNAANSHALQVQLQNQRAVDAAEIRVAEMVGDGQVDLAQQFAAQNGVEMPATFWAQAKTDAGMQQIIKVGAATRDDGYMKRLYEGYLQTGDVEQTIRAAGPPPVANAATIGASGKPLAGRPGASRGSQPKEVATAEWLVANLGMTPEEAWQSASDGNFSPETEAAKVARAMIENGQIRKDEFEGAYQKALGVFRGTDPEVGAADPLGLGFAPPAAPVDADPLGLR